MGAEVASELYCVGAHPAGGAVDEDSLASVDAAAAKEVERTERTDWERRGLLVAGAGGSDHDHPVVGDTDILGVCPGEGDAPEDAEALVPDAEGVTSLPTASTTPENSSPGTVFRGRRMPSPRRIRSPKRV